jgi:hypothetical protein
MRLYLISFIFLCLLNNSIFAQKKPQYQDYPANETYKPLKTNSINFNFLGLLAGPYSLNYMKILKERHAIIVEAEYFNASNILSILRTYGGSLGYRFLLSESQNTGFVGINTRYKHFDFGFINADLAHVYSTYGILGNVGQRWSWDTDLNVTARFGVGYQTVVYPSSYKPEDQKSIATFSSFNSYLALAIEAELSIGYNF